MPMLIFLANFLLFACASRPAQIVGFVLSLAGIALTASHGEPPGCCSSRSISATR